MTKYTGTLKHLVPQMLGSISVDEDTTYDIITVTISGEVLLKLPISKTADINQVQAVISNVCNQTDLIATTAIVEIEAVP